LKIYIDCDALPNLIKPVIFRAINRFKIISTAVSNTVINFGDSEYLNYIIVKAGPDEADDCIVEMIEEGDLVITADIPLADRAITKKAYAIDFRGKLFSSGNIKQSLAMRDLMKDIRDSGDFAKGPSAFKQKDVRVFANQLDRFLLQKK